MDEKIRGFEESFIIADNAAVIKNLDSWLYHMETKMRDLGYVPYLDLPPRTSTVYTDSNGGFECTVTTYGIYVGQESWSVDAVVGGKKLRLPKHTQNLKLQEF